MRWIDSSLMPHRVGVASNGISSKWPSEFKWLHQQIITKLHLLAWTFWTWLRGQTDEDAPWVIQSRVLHPFQNTTRTSDKYIWSMKWCRDPDLHRAHVGLMFHSSGVKRWMEVIQGDQKNVDFEVNCEIFLSTNALRGHETVEPLRSLIYNILVNFWPVKCLHRCSGQRSNKDRKW